MSPSAADIIAATAKVFMITPSEVTGAGRWKHAVRARWVAAHLLYTTPIPVSGVQRSAVLVGKALGGRDHSTIRHGFEQLRAELARNPHYAEGFALVRAELGLPAEEAA